MTDARSLDEHTMESRGERHDPASRGERQPAVKLTAIVAAGFAAAVAAFFTSRFGIAGTVLGTAATAMIITAGSAVIGFFFEYAADKARVLPGTLHVRPPRRSVLLGGLVAAAASFLIGMAAVTGVELGVGKSLSCWVWHECSTKDDGGREAASRGTTGTHPSILGGGQRTVAPAPQPGGVEQHQQIASHHEQEVPDSPHAPQGRLGGAVRAEPREGQDAGPHLAPDGQAPKEPPSAAPRDRDRPVPSGDSPANRPPSRQPAWPSPSIFQ